MDKKRDVKLRHYIITRLLSPFLWLFFALPYRLKIKRDKRITKKGGPYVILANHTIAPDPIIMGMHFPFHIYYIATEQIFNLGFKSKLLTYLVNPIKKTKSMSDLSTIRKIRKIVKEGGSIGIYPEGNITYTGETATIQKSTVKLIKMLKLPLVIMNKMGLYFSNPRWAVYKKKGKSRSFIKTIIDPKGYMSLSDDELYEIIKKELYVNDYLHQEEKEVLFKGKKIAEGLERLIFIDLLTNKPFTTYTTNNKLKSHDSDFELTYLPNGYVVDNKGVKYTLIEMDKQVKLKYFEYYKLRKSNFIDLDEVILSESFVDKKILLGNGKMTLNKDSLEFENENYNFLWHFDDIQTIAIQGKRQILVYLENQTYIFKLDDKTSPYKYLLTFQYYQFIKSGGSSINEKLFEFGL